MFFRFRIPSELFSTSGIRLEEFQKIIQTTGSIIYWELFQKSKYEHESSAVQYGLAGQQQESEFLIRGTEDRVDSYILKMHYVCTVLIPAISCGGGFPLPESQITPENHPKHTQE